MTRLCHLVCFVPLILQAVEVERQSIDQGGAVRVTAGRGDYVRFSDKKFALFDENGKRSLLLPIQALTKPGAYKLEVLDSKDQVLESTTLNITDAHFPHQNITLSKSLTELKPAPGEMETVAAFRSLTTTTRYWQEPLLTPVTGCMTSPFGVQRYHNGKPTGNIHSGLDQRAPMGGEIRSTAAGVVKLVKEYNIHGNVVGVDHGHGLVSIYLHMSKFAVTEGQQVTKGGLLGYAGSSGRSTGPHLHWSLYDQGVAINPRQWIEIQPCATAPPAKAATPPKRRRTR